jgi:predicted MFS family arabinose efflux permease
MMLLALILAGLTFAGVVQPWHVLALAVLLSVANAFDAPARISFVKELVPDEDMTNAIALNATMFNIGTVSGPAIAGITYSLVGPGWCFFLNGVSFIAIIIALGIMQISFHQTAHKDKPLREIAEGLRYVRSQPLIMGLIGFMGLVAILGISVLTLLPAWSVEVLGGDVTTNGLLLSVRGGGALISALMLAALGKFHIRGKLWTIGSLLMPVSLIIFAQVRWLPLSLVIFMLMGWSFVLIANNSNAMIQSHVRDELRGRVMSIYTLAFFVSMPVGSLLVGFLAERTNAPFTVTLLAGVLLAFAVGTYVFFPRIRTEQ